MIGVVIILLFVYIFCIYILPRFIVPNYGFVKSKLPQKIPAYFQEVIDKQNKKSPTQEDFLKNAYVYITTTYNGARFRTFIYFLYLFDDPFIHKNGFAQCNIQNYLLRALLVKSGRFEEKDIRVRTTFLNFFTHQYLQVHVGDKWIYIDPHAKSLGIPFGERAFLFA